MTIRGAEAYLCDLEPPTARYDAIQAFVEQETMFVDRQGSRRAPLATRSPGNSAVIVRSTTYAPAIRAVVDHGDDALRTELGSWEPEVALPRSVLAAID
jgi:hypothetical protein